MFVETVSKLLQLTEEGVYHPEILSSRGVGRIESGQRVVLKKEKGHLVYTNRVTGRHRRHKILHEEERWGQLLFYCNGPGDEDLQPRFRDGKLSYFVMARTLSPHIADSRRESAVARGGTDAEIADRYNNDLFESGYIYEPKATPEDVAEWKADWEAGLWAFCPKCLPRRRLHKSLALREQLQAIKKGGTDAEIARRYNRRMQDQCCGDRATAKDVVKWRAAF